MDYGKRVLRKNMLAGVKRRRKFRRRKGPIIRRRRMPLYKSLPLSGFPKSKMVRLRYAEEILLNSGAGGSVTYNVFRANGLYDPHFTGVGHQPRGFDEWTNVYDHYTVLGAMITMRWLPSSATDKVPSAFGVAISDDVTLTGVTNLAGLIETVQGGRTWRTSGLTSQATAGKSPQITRKFSAKKFFGTKNIVGKDLYRGTAITNPTEAANFLCWMSSSTTADAEAISFMVTIDYIAVFTERRGLPAS